MAKTDLRAWLREPLLHFLLIGVLIFGVYRALNPGANESPREIVITEARIQALAENFARTWRRPPTPEELRGLVNDYVAEEVYYREAMAMGLDRDDVVIRRRLRQKMEFISADVAVSVPPTEAQLQEYLAKHPDSFRRPPTYSFRQVYISTERRGAAASAEAKRVLAELNSGRDAADAGDPTLLPPAMESASSQDIENTFGSEFAAAVESAPVGQWSGPVASGYGLHLLRVDATTPGSLPPLAGIRDEVAREWESEQRRKTEAELLARLKARYEIRFDLPHADSPVPAPRTQPAQKSGSQP